MEAFFEVVFSSRDLEAAGVESRDEIEDALQQALKQAGVGEVSGGGSGSGVMIIDVDVLSEDRFEDAVKIVRRVLQSLDVPPSTRLKRYRPSYQEFEIYGSGANDDE